MLVILCTSFVSKAQIYEPISSTKPVKKDSIAILADSARIALEKRLADSIKTKKIDDSIYRTLPKTKPIETATPIPWGVSKEALFKMLTKDTLISCSWEKVQGGWQKIIKIKTTNSEVTLLTIKSNIVKKKLPVMDAAEVTKRIKKKQETLEIESAYLFAIDEDAEIIMTYMDRTGGNSVKKATEKIAHPYQEFEDEGTRQLQQLPEYESPERPIKIK